MSQLCRKAKKAKESKRPSEAEWRPKKEAKRDRQEGRKIGRKGGDQENERKKEGREK